MPAIANIVIKKKDNATDVTYTAVVSSAGDKSPAVWKNNSIGTVPASRPVFTLVSMDNGTRKARRLRSSFLWPKTRTDTNGNVIVTGGASSESSHLIPQDMTTVEIEDYVNDFAGLLKSQLIQACLVSGYSAT